LTFHFGDPSHLKVITYLKNYYRIPGMTHNDLVLEFSECWCWFL